MKESTMPAPPISQNQFVRIFQTLYSALDERAIVERSCMFFAFTGSLILQENYGIDCRPYAGAALLNIGDSANTVLTFGRFENGQLSSDQNAFHCWIESDDFAIDFMSPIYSENMRSSGFSINVPRRSFMKPISSMVDRLEKIEQPRSFALQQDPELTNQLVDKFCENETSLDLLSACKKWFKPHPYEMPNTMFPTDSGRLFPFFLHGPTVDGHW